jgi:hypothetical protein
VSNAPPGWYPDPTAPGGQRYWDGSAWAAPGPEFPLAGAGALTTSVRQWAMAAHLSALLGMLVAFAFLGPLVVYLARGNDHPFIRQQAIEAINFNLSFLIYAVAGGALAVVLIFFIVGVVLIPILIAGAILWLVLVIVAGVRANSGEAFRYPLTIRFMR